MDRAGPAPAPALAACRCRPGYAAQQTCAYLYISHRTLDSCLGDLEPLARKLISVRPGSDEVTASGFLLVTATAHYEQGFGCALRD